MTYLEIYERALWDLEHNNITLGEFEERVKPLNQEVKKIGHWIKSRDCYGNNHFTCPFCGHDIATKADIWNDNYCSNCGAKMEGE